MLPLTSNSSATRTGASSSAWNSTIVALLAPLRDDEVVLLEIAGEPAMAVPDDGCNGNQINGRLNVARGA